MPQDLRQQVEAADAELARLGRSLAALRLRIGDLLRALFEAGGHHELGFSSKAAYALERAGQSARWTRDVGRVAKRIRDRRLVRIERAILTGQLTWSMVELLVRYAKPENEAELLEAALARNVRQMRAWLKTKKKKSPPEEDDPVRMSRSVGTGEVFMVSGSRMLVEYLEGGRVSDEHFLTALLGEAETTLLGLTHRTVEDFEIRIPELDPEQLRALCGAIAEGTGGGAPRHKAAPNEKPASPMEPVDFGPLPEGALALDREIRRRARELAERDLLIGEHASLMIAGNGWRILGYETRKQYAEERVGMSVSGLEHRALLFRRARFQPGLREALLGGQIGYEAALQITRLPDLGPAMTAAWIARAKKRTAVHLREEVKAVLLRRALDRMAPLAPPDDEALAEVAEIERKVISGELFRSLLGARLDGPQMSVALPVGSGAEIVLRVPAEIRDHYERVEALFRELAGPRASFVAFMCLCLWASWLPYLEAFDDKWIEVYDRDVRRCTSPVCESRDLTPHHLDFRAHGGGDELENVTTLCPWCHLEGIHGGRLRATPPASDIHWEIGREPILEVHGREVLARAG